MEELAGRTVCVLGTFVLCVTRYMILELILVTRQAGFINKKINKNKYSRSLVVYCSYGRRHLQLLQYCDELVSSLKKKRKEEENIGLVVHASTLTDHHGLLFRNTQLLTSSLLINLLIRSWTGLQLQHRKILCLHPREINLLCIGLVVHACQQP